MDLVSHLRGLSQRLASSNSDIKLVKVRQASENHTIWRIAGPLKDPTKLRYQAVFVIGAGGSGKSYVSHKWLKYMPGGGSGGASRDMADAQMQKELSEQERGLTNLDFEKAMDRISDYGFKLEPAGESARIPFRVYEYDNRGAEIMIPPEEWEERLPPTVYREVKGLTEVVFGTPKHELPSYWRVVNPDLYKEELAGYLETNPGFVHEMSSEMSKAYFEATIETGDPLIVDGTGKNLRKIVAQIQKAKAAGYRTSVVMVWVPLTVNHIRNATRARNVDPRMVTRQWKIISKNYAKLRNIADKAHFVDNRFDAGDFKRYRQEKDKINSFINSKTEHSNLYELIAEEAPNELRTYGKLLQE